MGGIKMSSQRIGGRLKVVVVDDNPMTMKLASYLFNEDGWEVFGFTSPLLALEAMKAFEPDLIITDYRMPEMNGPEFLLAASQMHDLTPGMVMTAFNDDPSVAAELRRAAVPCVRKTDGLTEITGLARKLVAVRQSLRGRALGATV